MQSDYSLLNDKQDIRKKMMTIRDNIPPDVRQFKENSIRYFLFNNKQLLSAKKVLTYVSFRSEVDTIQIIEELLGLRKDVVVPRIVSHTKSLLPYIVRDIGELSRGTYGILEPINDKIFNYKRQVADTDIDICITPGVAFDEKKNRLGYGKGYYDRYLKPLKTQKADKFLIIGIAYEDQILISIPHTEEDVKMDIVITDKRMIV